MLWVRISIRARCKHYVIKVCQWLATGRWFALCSLVYSTNKTDSHDIPEILLKVTLNFIKQTALKKIHQIFWSRCTQVWNEFYGKIWQLTHLCLYEALSLFIIYGYIFIFSFARLTSYFEITFNYMYVHSFI